MSYTAVGGMLREARSLEVAVTMNGADPQLMLGA